ncbi:MAG: protein kinase [Verrucomicrobiota bacterium]
MDPDPLTETPQLEAGHQLGHYVIIERIAEGGMGTVYKALEPDLERHVAIKILHGNFASDPSHQAQFREEAKAVAALRHTNIVPLYYVGHDLGFSYFAMAYIEGQTLDDYMEQLEAPLTPDQARWFLNQAIAALDYAARANVIHLDIKPSNFMVDKDSILMLTDFGLARRKKDGDEGGDSPELMGTPYYASPEHVLQQEPDLRTDIYCLGATLYHLMAGVPVFEGESLEEICLSHVSDEFPVDRARAAGIPFGWTCLLHRMMEKAPAYRFQTYEELGDALANVDHYRYGRNVISLPPVHRRRATPSYGSPPETLFGILPPDASEFDEGILDPKAPMSGDEVMDAFDERFKLLNLNVLADSIRELSQPAQGELIDLVVAMDHSEVFGMTVDEITGFMAGYSKENLMDNSGKVELLGLDRGQNLGVLCLLLQRNWYAQRPLDWRGLWQHQIACGLLLEMMIEALEIPTSGLEFAAGCFHDIGKLVYAELFPSHYPAVILHSLRNDMPLEQAEVAMLGIDHAQMGEMWLNAHRINPALCAIVDTHHQPDEAASPRKTTGFLSTTVKFLKGDNPVDVALLSHAVASANHLVKEQGHGFSGNTWMEQLSWPEHPSTQYLWEARQNQELEFSEFTDFFVNYCPQFPPLTVAGFGLAPESPAF